MHQVGEKFMYGVHGVCSIIDVETRRVDRKNVEYLVLAPVDQPSARFYVPAHNEIALSKLRPLLSREAVECLFDAETTYANCWIPDENRRKLRYRELINNGERTELISMIRAVLLHRESQLSAGRKFHLCDENFLRDAQKILASEFSYILQIPRNEAIAYIENKLIK